MSEWSNDVHNRLIDELHRIVRLDIKDENLIELDEVKHRALYKFVIQYFRSVDFVSYQKQSRERRDFTRDNEPVSEHKVI